MPCFRRDAGARPAGAALIWVEPPTFPGAKLIVQGDPGKEGLFVYRVKMPANYKIAPRYSQAVENVTVLSGVFFIGTGEKFDQGSGKTLPVGGFIASRRRIGTSRGPALRRR